MNPGTLTFKNFYYYHTSTQKIDKVRLDAVKAIVEENYVTIISMIKS